MIKHMRFHFLTYTLVSVISVCLAFLVSLKFVTHAHSQTPPAAAPAAPAATPVTPAPGAPTTPGSGVPAPPEESASAVAAEVQGFLEPFLYDSKNRRDPFQPYVEFRGTENAGYVGPLQRWELDEFKLVGIMWDVHSPKAMFMDPDRQVHVVGRDESIGKRNGYIATIREGEVVVVESTRKAGEMIFKPRILRIER